MLKEELKINQLVKLKPMHRTSVCARGGAWEVYRVVKIYRMNCIAVNLGTQIDNKLRIANLIPA
jgi:hypothetical protein